MAKVVTPTTCKVVVISKAKPSNYGEGQTYRAVLFADTRYPEGSEEAKVWKNLSEEEASQLKKGEMVQLVPTGTDKNGNPKHQIVQLTPAPVSQASEKGKHTDQSIAEHYSRTAKPALGEWSDEQKRAIAAQVTQNARLMRFCLETSKAQFGDLVESEESLRSLATTLFVQTMK